MQPLHLHEENKSFICTFILCLLCAITCTNGQYLKYFTCVSVWYLYEDVCTLSFNGGNCFIFSGEDKPACYKFSDDSYWSLFFFFGLLFFSLCERYEKSGLLGGVYLRYFNFHLLFLNEQLRRLHSILVMTKLETDRKKKPQKNSGLY